MNSLLQRVTIVTVTSVQFQRTAAHFSSEKVLELLFDDDFYQSDGCNNDEECGEGPPYLGMITGTLTECLRWSNS